MTFMETWKQNEIIVILLHNTHDQNVSNNSGI